MPGKRMKLIMWVVILLMGVLVWRLYMIQIVRHEEYFIEAKRRHMGIDNLKADRGIIYDRNMEILALTDPVKSFYVAIRQAKANGTVGVIAGRVAKVTGKDSAFYHSRIVNAQSSRVCLERVSDTLAVKLSRVKKTGLYAVNEPVRIYPGGNLASHVLGFADIRTLGGREGIERSLDSLLRGQDGSRTVMLDNSNNTIAVIEESTLPPRQGHSVILTIDKRIQEALETELDSAQSRHRCDYMTGIVLDPFTGEVLAISNKEDFNPNAYRASPIQNFRNHAVSDVYEPASTLKTISLASFLDMGICKEDEVIFCENGVYNHYGARLSDSKPHGMLTVREVFAHSSNIGMCKLSHRANKEEFYRYLRAFGFGSPVNVGLPAEGNGRLPNPEISGEWSRLTKGTLSFGYELLVSPMQLISAYASVINGGWLMQPQIVKRIESAEGKSVFDFTPKKIRQTIRPETSERMKKLLQAVVSEGTAKGIRSADITLGGKTGTTHIYKDKKMLQDYNSWFVGFFPVENPKYLCLILARSPKGGQHYGADVAAPVFRNFAYAMMKCDAELTRHVAEGQAPAGLPRTAAKEQPASVYPKSAAQSEIQLPADKRFMPDLRGKTVREAVMIMNYLSLDYHIEGFHRVVAQDIPPGTRIRKGIRCKVTGHKIQAPLAGVTHWN